MELWIARDKDNNLFLYKEKPVRIDEAFEVFITHPMQLDSKLFKEITWKNSPQKVKISLIK